MNSILPLEIRKFFSLIELSSYLDRNIAWYELFLDDYSRILGTLLREAGVQNEEELKKKLVEKGFSQQAAKKKEDKESKQGKDKKNKKGKKEEATAKGC